MIFKMAVILLLSITLLSSGYSASLYGHRGARGLAPENTLPGYQAAMKIPVDYVDMDVTMTKDHVVVVQHDLALNPELTRDSQGHWIKNKKSLIKHLTLKDLQTYDVGRIKPHTRYADLFPATRSIDGTHIPTLQQVVRYVKAVNKKTGFQIEIKTDPTKPDWTFTPAEIAKAVVKIIHAENITDRAEVQAYDWRCLLAIQKLDSRIKTTYITDVEQEKLMRHPNPALAGLWTAGKLLKDYHDSIPQMIAAMGGKVWSPQDIEVTHANLSEAHALGLKVIVWTWPEMTGKKTDLSLMQYLLGLGIDGIITDRPDMVAGLLRGSSVRGKRT